MALGIVDRLESVDIDVGDRQRLIGPQGTVDLFLQLVKSRASSTCLGEFVCREGVQSLRRVVAFLGGVLAI